VTFGQRIAEQEVEELSSYFVETVTWRSIYAGEVDVVYGPKGSGKSALYSLLREREQALRARHVVLISAENPSGAPVFRDLIPDPPGSVAEFRNLWKLYVLSLVARQLREQRAVNAFAQKLIREMEQAGLIPREASLRGVLRSVIDYIGHMRSAEGIEAGLRLDPVTASAQPVLRILFREPSSADRALGHTSADELLELANEALQGLDLTVWVLFDRLDVAFSESAELEANALAALFRAYLDIQHLKRLSLKIFLRNDIWQRVTRSGFPEASHITRSLSIVWNKDSLMNPGRAAADAQRGHPLLLPSARGGGAGRCTKAGGALLSGVSTQSRPWRTAAGDIRLDAVEDARWIRAQRAARVDPPAVGGTRCAAPPTRGRPQGAAWRGVVRPPVYSGRSA
jgi:hypothetical protein